MLERELEEFGRRMGIHGFGLDARGIAMLDVENFGRLFLERSAQGTGDDLLVYVSLPIPAHDAGAPERVLSLCGYEHAHPLPLFGGVHGQSMLLLTRLPAQTLRAADIENAAQYLAHTLKKAL